MNQIATIGPEKPEALLAIIARAVADPQTDPARLTLLMQIHHDMTRAAYSDAMSAAQAEMLPIVRDASNSFIGNKYARLAAIDAGIRPIYTRHGFSVRYGTKPPVGPGWINVTCTIAHRSGYEETISLDSPLDSAGAKGNSNKTPIQAVGSTVTYLRRYLLCMAFNCVIADDPDDDDGEATRGRGRSKFQDPPPPPRQKIRDWLAELGGECARCEWPEELDTLEARPDVQQAKATLVNGAKERFDEMFHEARVRVNETERHVRGDA